MTKHRLGAVLAGLLALVVNLAPTPALAASPASYPPPPPGYTPHFVTQTDQPPPWRDCVWASGAMLLDKWSQGAIVLPDERVLRTASGDARGGSTLRDLALGVERYTGLNLLWSPAGGDPLTWPDLLERLSHGGGAVLGGKWHKLHSRYSRVIRLGHAVYVEQYQPEANRMWLMDPIGRGAYVGEWVSADNVYKFVQKDRAGYLFGAATPRPFSVAISGWVIDQVPRLSEGSRQVSGSLTLHLPVLKRGPWQLPALQLQAHWELLASYALPTPSPTPLPSPSTLSALAPSQPSAPDKGIDDHQFVSDNDGQFPYPSAPTVPTTVITLPNVDSSAPHVWQSPTPGAPWPTPTSAASGLSASYSLTPSATPIALPTYATGAPVGSVDVDGPPLETAVDHETVLTTWSPAAVHLDLDQDGLGASLALPDQPGRWRVWFSIAGEQGDTLPEQWQPTPLELTVWGERGAQATAILVSADPAEPVLPGTTLSVAVEVTNTGSASWLTVDQPGAVPLEDTDLVTHLVAELYSADGTPLAARHVTLDNAAGETSSEMLTFTAPPDPGSYRITFDVRDVHGGYSELGMPMPELWFQVERVPNWRFELSESTF